MVETKESTAKSSSTADRQTVGVTGLLGALVEGYVELVSESVRLAGNVIGDVADGCAAPLNRCTDEEEDEHDEWSARETVEHAVDGCAEVINESTNRFDRALDRRRHKSDDD